jgi:hypothetical protein
MRYAMNAVKYQKSASAGGHWDRIDVYRGEEHLGNLYDIRQALIFAQNEYDFHCQLKFIHGRPRRVHKGQQTEGYRSVEGSGLYRKIRRDDFPRHNHDLIIDLGDELNDSLAACAHDGFMIVMCDMRMLNNDGIPTPKGTGIETVYEQGPDSFPTLFARDLASVYGWSKGYAHIGPLGLGKGWSTGLWSRGRGMTSAPHAVRKEQDPNSWLDYFAVKQELTPKGCVWTEEEISRVKAFHQANIAGRIEHFPFPITMGMRSKPAPLSTNKFGNPAVPITRKVSPVRIAHKARPVEAVSNSRPTGDSTPTATVEENLPQPCHIDRPAIAQPLDHAGFPAQSHAPLDQIDIAHQALQVMANPSPQSAMGTSRYHHDENPHTFASRDYDDGNHRSFHSGSQLAERTDKYHYEGMPRTSSWGAHYEGNHRSIIRTHSSISQNTVPQLPQPRLQPYSANMTWPVHRVDDTNTRYQQYVASAPQNTLQEMNQTAHQHDLGNAQGRLEFNQMYNFQPPETPGFRKRRRPRRSFAEIGERPYKCGWQGCDKAYDTLGNLNDHVGNKSHGPRRTRNVTTVNSTAGFAPIPAVYKYKCGWKGCHKSFPELRKLNNHINMFSHGPLPTPSGFPLLTDSDDPKSLYPEVPAQESPSSHESSEPESFGIGSDCSEYPQLENTTLFSQSPSLMSNGPRSFGMMNGITQRRQSDSPAPLAPTPYQGFGLDGCDDESAEKRGSADSGYRSQSPLLASSNSGKSPGTEGSQKKKRTGKSAIDEHDALNSESRKSGFAAKGTKPLQAYYGRRSEPSSIAAGPTASFFGTVTQLGPPAPQSSVFPLSSGFLRQTEEDLYASITSNPPVRDQVNSDRAANDYTMQLSFEHMPQIFAPSHTSSLSSRPSRCLVPIDQWNMSQNIDPVLKNSAEPEYLAPAQVKQEHDLMHTESFTSPFSHSSSDYTTIPALPSHPMHPSPNSFGGNTVPRQSQGHNRPSSSAGSYPFFMPPAQIILEGNTANHPHGHSHLSRSSSSLLPTSIYSRKTSYESYRSARQPQAISYSHEELFGGPDSASTEPEPEKKPEYPDPDEAASPMPTSYFPTPSPPTVPSRSEIHPTLPERSPPRPPVQDLALLPKKRKSIPWEDQDYEENPKSKRKCK